MQETIKKLLNTEPEIIDKHIEEFVDIIISNDRPFELLDIIDSINIPGYLKIKLRENVYIISGVI